VVVLVVYLILHMPDMSATQDAVATAKESPTPTAAELMPPPSSVPYTFESHLTPDPRVSGCHTHHVVR